MYNLLVSANANQWNGDPFVLPRSRCITQGEHTASDVANRFSQLNREQVRNLCSLPSVFAYERDCGIDPKFGFLRAVKPRGRRYIQIEYTLVACQPFATMGDLESLGVLLDIRGRDLDRTHWAVKDADLAVELGRRGIMLPRWASMPQQLVDLRRHCFRVALSFPGEFREFIESVAIALEQQLGPNSCFYDNLYEAQLARPNLDLLLHEIYGERSDLVVAFVSRLYDQKKWCGIEWQKIRERTVYADESQIMYVRLDEGDVAGMTRLDGFVDARTRKPEDVPRLIIERVEIDNATSDI